ncbi:hypothetical protein MMC16_003367 [Acarospora aff. strigata]|nr:hypothetical protein [Acarospora aff. strigata]
MKGAMPQFAVNSSTTKFHHLLNLLLPSSVSDKLSEDWRPPSRMARRTALHWIGVLFLLTASLLLLITSISAPVIADIAMLKVKLTNHTQIRNSAVTFGTFGHCILDIPPIQTDQDYCFPKQIGYQPASIMAAIDGSRFDRAASGNADRLTNLMILHPIACGLAFLAFQLALGAGVFVSTLSALIAGLAWIVTLVVMAIDFALFGIIKNHVNNDGSGSHAYYSTGMWTVLAAMILLFLGTLTTLLTCFRAREQVRVPKVWEELTVRA